MVVVNVAIACFVELSVRIPTRPAFRSCKHLYKFRRYAYMWHNTHMQMIGYVLYVIFFVLCLCYVAEGYNTEKAHLRSVSSLVCMRKEIGTYALSLGNLVISLIAFRADSTNAWVIYLAGQGVISFFLDTFPIIHHIFLTVYIASLLVFSGHVCNENPPLWLHSYPLFVLSVFFSAAVIINNTCADYTYLSTQALLELLWILSFVYFVNVFEKSITT
jgi:hypothetical protein